MSDSSAEWWAQDSGHFGWHVWTRLPDGKAACIAAGLDEPTARLISAAEQMRAALKHIVKEWDGEPEDMHDARMALAKARGDEPPKGWGQ